MGPDSTLQTRAVVRVYHCMVCSHEAAIDSKILAPGVIGFIVAHCATCPGNPEMVVKL